MDISFYLLLQINILFIHLWFVILPGSLLSRLLVKLRIVRLTIVCLEIYMQFRKHDLRQFSSGVLSKYIFVRYLSDAAVQFYLFRFAVPYYRIRVRPWNEISFSRRRCGFRPKRCWAFARRRKRERLRAPCFNQYICLENRVSILHGIYLNIPEHVGANCHVT